MSTAPPPLREPVTMKLAASSSHGERAPAAAGVADLAAEHVAARGEPVVEGQRDVEQLAGLERAALRLVPLRRGAEDRRGRTRRGA